MVRSKDKLPDMKGWPLIVKTSTGYMPMMSTPTKSAHLDLEVILKKLKIIQW